MRRFCTSCFARFCDAARCDNTGSSVHAMALPRGRLRPGDAAKQHGEAHAVPEARCVGPCSGQGSTCRPATCRSSSWAQPRRPPRLRRRGCCRRLPPLPTAPVPCSGPPASRLRTPPHRTCAQDVPAAATCLATDQSTGLPQRESACARQLACRRTCASEPRLWLLQVSAQARRASVQSTLCCARLSLCAAQGQGPRQGRCVDTWTAARSSVC